MYIFLKKKEKPFHRAPLLLPTCEDVARRLPSINQAEGPGQTPNLPALRSWIPSLQNSEKCMSVVCKPRVYGILWQQPEWAKTLSQTLTQQQHSSCPSSPMTRTRAWHGGDDTPASPAHVFSAEERSSCSQRPPHTNLREGGGAPGREGTFTVCFPGRRCPSDQATPTHGSLSGGSAASIAEKTEYPGWGARLVLAEAL